MADLNILRAPDQVTAFLESGAVDLSLHGGEWRAEDLSVVAEPRSGALPVTLTAPRSAVTRLRLRWKMSLAGPLRLLADHWERGYGDLEWRGLVPERVMPWYFLLHDGQRTHGVGVKTQPNALCFWQADAEGVTLWLDVRSGGGGVHLGERTLDAATVVVRPGQDAETPFAAAQAFCRQLCDAPRRPSQPVYGGNNWYYAYGNSSHAQILEDSRLIAALAPTGDNHPFMVIDDGWQISGPVCNGGPWAHSNARFPDMTRLAQEMRDIGVRPGLWIRPLVSTERHPSNWFRGKDTLDASRPEVLDLVRTDIARCVSWGYEMIKHDFSTFDITGRWGFEMGAEVTDDGRRFADASKTTAEIILRLYRTIREAAGGALLLGCNTVGHLAAGLVELQRTGDDTSGRVWERTRKMGINTLAFRMPQHDAFFAVDADCVGLTKDIPWDLNSQWLDLLARSGTPLFVSAAPDAVGPAQEKALRAAFAAAAQTQAVGEPMDWLETTCPVRWQIGGQEERYDWSEPGGASPFRE